MLLDEIATLLQTAGVGTLATDMYKGGIPLTAQDALVALIETPGLAPARIHDHRAYAYEQPVIQILARGTPYDYSGCRTRAQQAFDALDGLSNVMLGSSFYLWIQALQSPFWLRSDEAHRPIIVFNLRCART